MHTRSKTLLEAGKLGRVMVNKTKNDPPNLSVLSFRLTWIPNFVRAYHGATTPTRQSTTLENPSTISCVLVPSRYEYTSFFAQRYEHKSRKYSKRELIATAEAR